MLTNIQHNPMLPVMSMLHHSVGVMALALTQGCQSAGSASPCAPAKLPLHWLKPANTRELHVHMDMGLVEGGG